jgi:ABC-type dipeptide/oligopeptide/nickel transport system permease component
LGPDASRDDISALREQMGLNRPLPVQYLSYLGSSSPTRQTDPPQLNRPAGGRT